MNLFIVPSSQTLVAGGALHIAGNWFSLRVFGSPQRMLLGDSVMFLHDVSVEGLFILGAVVATRPRTRESDVLSLPVFLPHMLLQEMLVTVTFLAHITYELLGHVIFSVNEKLLGIEF